MSQNIYNMKKLMILIAACALSSGAFAQDHDMGKMGNQDNKEQKIDMKKDHVMMKDGKMHIMKDGKTTHMDKEMTMGNGTTVMADGMCKMKGGKTMKMKEGDMMDMDGKMGKMPIKKKTGSKSKMGKMPM